MTPTITEIEFAFKSGQKITLIKLYRDMKGGSLLDAKNAIETILPAHSFPEHSAGDYTQGNQRKMVDLILGTIKMEDDASRLMHAINTMSTNWKTLGYVSFKQGINALLINF